MEWVSLQRNFPEEEEEKIRSCTPSAKLTEDEKRRKGKERNVWRR